MPKVKTNRVKYPEGWELIEPTIRELQAKMREGWNIICYSTLTRFYLFIFIFKSLKVILLYPLCGS